jgi:hypothetical protein
MGWYGMDWIDLAQDRDQWRALLKTVMNLWVPYNAGKFLSSCTIGFLKKGWSPWMSDLQFSFCVMLASVLLSAIGVFLGNRHRRLRLALSNGPNRIGIPLHSWGRKQIQFPKRNVFCNRTIDTVQKPSNSKYMVKVCHRDNKLFDDHIYCSDWTLFSATCFSHHQAVIYEHV